MEVVAPWTVSFPLPFRVFVLAGLGILGWATNLHGLHLSGIDVASAMELRLSTSKSSPDEHAGVPALYETTYEMALSYCAWVLLTWVLFRACTMSDISLFDHYAYIPAISTIILIMMLLYPFNGLFRMERLKFTQALRRCLFTGIGDHIYFADVVFADIFTSFAKVLGDIVVTGRMYIPGNSLLVFPDESGYLRWVGPTIMSLPYLVRLRQCIVEFSSSQNDSRKPLYNALKYATSFPVIFFSAAQVLVLDDLKDAKGPDVVNESWHGEHPLFRLWLLSAILNSLYSFWWDVTNDWGFQLLTKQERRPMPVPPRPLLLPRMQSDAPLLGLRSSAPAFSATEPRHPWGLRPTLRYPLLVYPLAIFLNLVLRMAWSVKLSSHLHNKTDRSMVIFCFEIAEIFRRWMWVFIRVEWEAIKQEKQGSRRLDTAPDRSGDTDYELVNPDSVGHSIP